MRSLLTRRGARAALWISLSAWAVAGTATLASTQIVPLVANDLAWDVARGRLWASVPSNGGTHANSVVAIDPATGALGPSVFVGSEPGELAISDDGAKLYVALEGAPRLLRVDLSGPSVDLEIPLAPDASGVVHGTAAIAVQPGSPTTLAIVHGPGVIEVFDDAVRRGQPMQLPPMARLAFGADGSQLFGTDGSTGASTLYELQIAPAGASLVRSMPGVLFGSDLEIAWDGLRITGTRGATVDVDAGTRAGVYANVSIARGVVADAAAGEIAFVVDRAIVIFDRATFGSLGTVPVAHVSSEARGLVRIGPRAWAFATRAGPLYVVRAEPGTADADHDGVADTLDNCPATANATQLNSDADALGDACEVRGPNDPVVQLPFCQVDVLSAQDAILRVQVQTTQQQDLIAIGNRELDYCQAPTDADLDGQFDRADQCDGTAAGASIDPAGCSQAQFCAQQGTGTCKKADFLNDETTRKKPKDCRVRGSSCQAF